MMRSIIAWSMQLRLLMVAAAGVLLFFGFTELRNMPLDIVPEFSRPYVEVQTEALGLSASEVEAMITTPIEADLLSGISWVEELRSESIPGLSSIVMFFEEGTDLMLARQVVQERLVAVHALPSVSKPPAMMQPLSSTSRVMKVGLTSKEHSLIEMSVMARWTIVPRLLGVPGVANASIWGQRKRQIQVQVDPDRLRDEGVNLHQVIEAAGNAMWVSPLSFLDASNPGTGGWIETPNQRLGVQHLLPISNAADLARVAVPGTIRNLGEIATVIEDHQPLIGGALVDDEPALMLVVEKFPWANTVDVSAGVDAALESLRLGLPGVELDASLYRPSTYLELALGNMTTAAVGAVVLMVIALFGMLLSWRAALISTLAVTMSVLVACTVLYVQGIAINMMIIAGLMVGLAALIDDAIIDIHGIVARLRADGGGDEAASAASIAKAVLASRSPMIYATMIVLLAALPFALMGGVLGVFSKTVAIAYAIALMSSMLVALTITPALSLLLLPEAASDRESPVAGALRAVLAGPLSLAGRAAGTPVLAGVAIVGAAVLVTAIAAPPAAENLLPEFRERDILVEMEGAPGTSGAAMRRIVSRATADLRSIDGVRNVSAHLGRAIMSDRVDHVNASELWVSMDRTAEYDATVAAIRAAMDGYPGFDIDVNTYLTEQMTEDATKEDSLVVRVYGEKLDMVSAKAEEVKRLLAGIDGVVETEVEHPTQHPELQIQVDLDRAQQHGIKPGDVRRAAATLLSGIEVGSLFEKQKVFDVIVWGTPEIRQNLSTVENLLIDKPYGGHVRLRDVADLRIASAPQVINRESVARYVDVSAEVNGRALASVAAEAEGKIRANIEFPLEYRAEVLPGYADRLGSSARVRTFAVVGAVATVLLLQAAFGSWSLAMIFFLSLPVAVLGGVFTGLVTGSLVSFGALFGLLAVFAVAARNGIGLIRHYRDLERSEGKSLDPELVQRGTADRLVPIVTSAVVTGLAFLPFAVFGGIAGNEILHPMAVVVIGGLISATLVSLVVVPALYLRFGADTDALDLTLEQEGTVETVA